MTTANFLTSGARSAASEDAGPLAAEPPEATTNPCISDSLALVVTSPNSDRPAISDITNQSRAFFREINNIRLILSRTPGGGEGPAALARFFPEVAARNAPKVSTGC